MAPSAPLSLPNPPGRCSTPLVRDRQRRLYCVSCELFAIREEDAQRAQQAQQAQQDEEERREAEQLAQLQRLAGELEGPQGAGGPPTAALAGPPAWSAAAPRLPAADGGTVMGAQVSPGVPAPAGAAPRAGAAALGARQGAAMVTGEPLLLGGAAGRASAASPLAGQLEAAEAAIGARLAQVGGRVPHHKGFRDGAPVPYC